MKQWMTLLSALAFLALAAPVSAQEGEAADSLEAAAEETPDTMAETPDTVAEETPDSLAEESPDWVFDLRPTDNAPGAKGTVSVTEGDTENTFVVEVEDVPVVDSLDAEGRDVNAYTVWIVPNKDKVPESALAGVLTVSPEGDGEFEGATALETFGIIVTATTDGAPAQISGVPVLTGIPATAAAETPAETETPAAEETPAVEPTPEAEPAPPADEPTPEAEPTPPADQPTVEE